MQFTEHDRADICVLTMGGSLLSEPEALRLRESIYLLVEQRRRCVVVDLSGVTYINSLGLGAFVSAMMTMRRAGGDVRLAGIHADVMKLFTITHLMKVFEIFTSVDDAVASYAKPPAD